MKTITKLNDIDYLKKLVLDFFKDNEVKIVLFGSRARKTNQNNSDADIGIIPKQSSSRNMNISLLKETIEQSNIPYKVDIVNLAETSPAFQRTALKEAVTWKE